MVLSCDQGSGDVQIIGYELVNRVEYKEPNSFYCLDERGGSGCRQRSSLKIETDGTRDIKLELYWEQLSVERIAQGHLSAATVQVPPTRLHCESRAHPRV